ncbi:MAG TPA: DNA polymerase III subunit delta [Pyrinomonadaceae bacterium]|nr:DNA polymerase III subunit delta [Pyrinomonadaceae bacterium]
MSSLTRTELERSLKAGKIAPLYLLVGCETYLRDVAARSIADAALMGTLLREFNESSFSLLSDSAMAAVAAAEQLPMMSERRVVKVKDFAKVREAEEDILVNYLSRPVDSTVAIFVADDLDKRKKLTKSLLKECTVVEFAVVKDAEAKAWARTRLKELKINADDRVLIDIVRLVGCNLQTLSSEVDKLAAAALETKQITTQMVDQLIGRSRELSNFDLGDQLIAGDRRRALETLHRLLEDDVAPVMLLGLIAGNYHRLAVAKELLNRGRRDEVYRLIYGPPSKRDAFMNTLQRSDASKISRGIKLIADADLAIKTSQGGGGPKGAKLQLEMLVVQLSEN